ncbi:MAG: TonB-dependent receptor [Acidobacteriota bacterium]
MRVRSWRRCGPFGTAALVLLLLPLAARAASPETVPLTGQVRSASGEPIPGATVLVAGTTNSAATGAGGAYRLQVPAGPLTLLASAPGYRAASRKLAVTAALSGIDFTLEPELKVAENVVVHAIRAEEGAPITKTDVDRPRLERLNYSQEMPFVLQAVPSLTNYSEDGLGAGYSYFYLRGIHQTRINMTLDGVPLNDPEESALYFANFGDFTSALASVQVQRGVGTSTFGAASYGGSVAFASVDPGDVPAVQAELQTGSFGSHRASAEAESGRIGDSGVALWGRVTDQQTDGFKDHSGIRQRSGYFAASWQGEKTAAKLFGFSGSEWTQLSYLATAKSILEHDLTYNEMNPEEHDHFVQNFVELQMTRLVGSSSTLAVQGYYEGAQGWFNVFDNPDTRDTLRKYGLSGYFGGATVTYETHGENWSLTGGVHANHFDRDHFQNLDGVEQYRNNGTKDERNGFVKASYDLGRWRLFADAQVRSAEFRYRGSVDLGSVRWTFFNPKLGVRYEISDRLAAYGSIGEVHREPTRSDMLGGADDVTDPIDLAAVKPERVMDVEAGLELRQADLVVRGDVYDMEFHDEIAATGQLSPTGALLRRNVDRSYRRGVELDVVWQMTPQLTLRHSANWSRSRIRSWTQYIDVYDGYGNYATSEPRTFRDVAPLLTPPYVGNLGIEWQPRPQANFALVGRYLAPSYLDNTNQAGLRTPSIFTLEASAVLDLSRLLPAGRPQLRVQVNNLLDNRRVWPSGYSYQWLERDASGGETLVGTPYYYPLATRAVIVSLTLRR